MSLQELGTAMQSHGVTTMWLTAGLFHQMVDEHLEGLAGLKQLLAGGDALALPQVRRVLDELDGVTMINGYGPTENTTFTTCHPMTSSEGLTHTVPIGKAIANTSVYVLDPDFEPVAVGMLGELFTGGAGLARGYMNRADLTAERFVPNPYGEAGSRMYKTGDVVKRLANETIEFVGRRDFQVKLRGFRIELGEIEAVLNEHPLLASSLILLREDQPGDKRLVAYLIHQDDGTPEDHKPATAAIRDYLEEKLPAYMVPSAFIWLETFPLNANGKVDRKKLPAPERKHLGLEDDYVAPRNATEEAVVEIWEDLLNLERVGATDHFFEVGGHSLLATRLVSQFRETFEVEIALREIFELPTVAMQAKRIAELAGGDVGGLPKIVPVERDRPVPLSFAQQRLWVIDQMAPGNPAYNIYRAMKVTGPFSKDLLEQTLNLMIARHESLRTTFTFKDNQPWQVIHTDVHQDVGYMDLRHLPHEKAWQEVERLTRREAVHRFDLEHGPLIRVSLIQVEDQVQIMQLCQHHIISDGWSMGILIGELSTIYGALSEEQEPYLQPLPVQYPDYAFWQRDHLEGAYLDEQIGFWQETLADIEPLNLPTDRPRPRVQTNNGKFYRFKLEAGEIQPLYELGRERGATPFMTLLTAFKVLLSRYCNTPDIVVGTPISGRNRGEVEPLIGFFVNTLVLRTNLAECKSFYDAVEMVHHSSLDAFSHQDVTFERMVEALKLPRDTSRNPVFDIMFSYHSGRQALDPGAERTQGELTFASYGTARETAQFDLTFGASESGDAVVCNFQYNSDLFDEATIEAMANHLRRLIGLMKAAPEQAFQSHDFTSEDERHQLLKLWNGTSSGYQPEAVGNMLERHAAQQPDHPAAVFSEAVGGEQLSYAELNKKANQLAHWLLQQGLKPETCVALYLERTHHLPVAIWAVLKAGGTYLMLDRNHPDDRRDYMLQDTGAPFILTNAIYVEELAELDQKVVNLDTLTGELQGLPNTNPGHPVHSDQLAYIIYTSGSTGRPKGVGITHRNLSNNAQQNVTARKITPQDGYLQFASLSFDISVSDQFNAWCAGATVVYRDESCMAGLDRFVDFLEAHEVTLCHLPTAFWNAWVYALEHGGVHVPDKLRLVIAGGEKAEREKVAVWFNYVGEGCQYINSYGPTEVTVDATNFHVDDFAQVPDGFVPIGTINQDYSGYVVDAHFQLTAPGVAGELVLGGDSVARGYINRPELTAAAFVPDPFAETPGSRLYRTGDLVRFNSSGNLVYLGRIDFQVKIRGFRIEPGEIEALLAQLDQVSQVIVSARKDPNNQLRLVAHIESGKAYDTKELGTYLHGHLPEYMVPDAFVVMESFPLTPGGKVNRKALPDPEYASSDNYVAPRDAVETQLAATWGDVLGMAKVGIYDNFFENGGHSLLATVLVGRIRTELQVDVPLTAVFEAPTVVAMAQIVARLQSEGKRLDLPPIVRVPRDQPLPLSFSQQRLWFIDQLDPGNRAYLMPQAFEVRGAFDVDQFINAINAVVARHESLRTIFSDHDGEATQIVLPEVVLDVPLVDVTDQPSELREDLARQQVADAMNKAFDLTTGPLLRALVVKMGSERHAVGICMHHIVSDGWSHGVFIREVGAIFEALLTEQPIPLPPLKLHYPDFAAWQRDYLAGERMQNLFTYWKDQFAALPDPLEIPTDHPRPQMQTFAGDTITVQLPSELTDGVRKLSRDHSATDFMTTLAAFNTLLARYTSREDLLVGTPIAGRNHPATEGMIGFFVNTLVMRNDLSGNPTYSDIIGRVKATALQAYTHQDMPFDMIVNELGLPRDLGRNPLFQVMFNYNKADATAQDSDGEMQFLPFNYKRELAHFDLTLTVSDHAKKGLVISFTYNSDLYERSTIQRLADHYQSLLQTMCDRPDQRMYATSLLAKTEAEQLDSWNTTDVAYEQTNIQTIFDQMAQQFADRPAIICAGEVVSYAELQDRANRLAHVLIDKGIGLESHVGVALNRSVDLCVAFIAILKAGGTFVPLDANLPDDRISFMLGATKTPLVIYDELWLNGRSTDLFEDRGCFKLSELADQLAQASPESPQVTVAIDQLAYVMFTSGSTGQPKGVSVPHRGVLRLVRNNQFLPVDETKTWLMIAPTHFDASTLEIWGAFLNGGKVAIYQSRVPVLEELADFIVEHQTTHTFLTVALMHQMVESHLECLRTFEFLSTGGDVFSPWHAARAVAELSGVRVVNGYGPTENTTFTTTFDVPADTSGDRAIPIGKPISNTRTYVLDKLLQPVPVGIPGELYTSGDGLARCYAQRPDLTAERFLPDVFGDHGQRMYKTGDLVRFGHDGLIHFMGRLDFQVKIRGFRIELGEIETVLTKLDEVKDALVIAADDGHGSKRLIGYLTTDLSADAYPSNNHMREQLGDALPEYMVPAAFVWLDTFPMTPSGKVDRRALPAPTISSEVEFVAPQSQTEIALAEIYATLLEQERVGLNDHFFELGGHSLIATRLVSRIRETFEIELPLRAVFESPTVGALAKRIEELANDPTAKLPAIVPVDRDRPIPLSFAQQRLWVIDQMDPGNPAYNIFMAFKIRGDLPGTILSQAGQLLLLRHESLRTVFTVVEGQPQQEVRNFDFKVNSHDLRGQVDAEATAQALINAESEFRFDLEAGPLFRLTHVRLEDQVSVLGIGMHHIISDGWSMGILMGELAALCEAVAEGKDATLPPLPVQYPDFAFWQREHLEGDVLDAQRDYWQTKLAGVEPLNLPHDFARPRVKTNRGSHHHFKIPKEVVAPLFAYGKTQGATPFMTLLAGFKVLLARYANMGDITVGTPISGRTRAEVEPLIGFFVNTLVLRTDMSAQPSFEDVVNRVRQTTLEAFSNQDITFERIVEALKLPRDTSRNPVFDVMFSYHSAKQEQQTKPDEDLAFENYGHESETSQFDLTLNASESGEHLNCVLEYSTELFETTTVAAMGEHLVNLLAALSAQPERSISSHSYMTEAQRELVLTTWNGKATYPEPTTIHAIFESHAQQRPDAMAAIFSDAVGGVRLSYAELNKQANQLAHWLVDQGVRHETVVALYLERTPHLPVAILATLKAGGCFMVLDRNHPEDRRAFMLEDTEAPIILTSADYYGEIAELSQQVVDLDAISKELADLSSDSPEINVDPDQLVYTIFTSGSTGRPKGVAITHRNIANYTRKSMRMRDYKPSDCYMQFAALSFDISMAEIFNAWTAGATLAFRDASCMEGMELFTDFIETHQVTILDLPTAFWHAWVYAVEHGTVELPQCVRMVIAGGDKAERDRLAAWFKHGRPGVSWINSYGPTEATIDAVNYRVTHIDQVPQDSIPIGKIDPDYTGYIVDERFELTPPGVAGELLLGGEGVGRGYLKRPDLTAAAFIPDPFSETPGVRLYRTGDLVRFAKDGNIIFMGRIDFQIKVRGYRIEPGEIEAQLAHLDEVGQVVITTQKDSSGQLRIVAYLETDKTYDQATLSTYLKERMPEYMVPSAFVCMETFPITPSGKIDRRALPAPTLTSEKPYVAPRNETEEALCQIFAGLLNIERVGIEDNFFELGGHSLLATQLMAVIHKELGVKLPMTLLFQQGTVAGLAAALESEASETASWTPLVHINGQSEGQPLFIVHPVGGGVLSYRELGLALKEDMPVYALEAQGLEEGEALEDFEAMAANYIAAIQSVQPQGPYRLAGWSLGGIVAWEMARQLEQNHDSQAQLILIDSYTTITDRYYSGPEILLAFVRDYGRLIGEAIDLSKVDAEELPEDDLESFILDEFEKQGAFEQPSDRERLRRQYRVFSANLTAAGDYEVEELERSQSYLIKASQAEDMDHGWDDLVPDEAQTAVVEGDHFTILQGDSAKALAALITKHLETEN
jgi:amino acid adenylation domain-containing protein